MVFQVYGCKKIGQCKVMGSLPICLLKIFPDIMGWFGSRNKNYVLFSKTEIDAENMFGSLLSELVSENISWKWIISELVFKNCKHFINLKGSEMDMFMVFIL